MRLNFDFFRSFSSSDYNNLWSNVKHKTFDKWAEEQGLTKNFSKIEIRNGKKFHVYDETCPKMSECFRLSIKHKKEQKKKHPFKYFLLISFPNYIEKVYMFPKKLINFGRYFFRYNFFDRRHLVDTGLPPNWYDTDTLIEKALETLLLQFVEDECAWHHIQSEDKLYKKYKGKKLSKEQSKEFGLEFLNFHINYKDEQVDYSGNNKAYQTIKDCYLYFVEEKPKILSQINELEDFKKGFEEEDKLHDLDTKYYTKLIEVRKSLWT